MITTATTQIAVTPQQIGEQLASEFFETYKMTSNVGRRIVDTYRNFEQMAVTAWCTGVRIAVNAGAAILSVPIWYAKSIAKVLWSIPLVRDVLSWLEKPAAKTVDAADRALSFVEASVFGALIAVTIADSMVAEWFTPTVDQAE